MCKILLSKGELGKFCQEFLERYNIKTDVGSEKPSLILNGKYVKFRVMRSRDVPRMFEKVSGDFGITGRDVVIDELLNGYDQDFNIIYSFKSCPDFVGNLCLLKKEETLKPRVVVSNYYENIAERYLNLMVKRREIEEYKLLVVGGSVEGYIAANEADVGIDTVYSGKTLERINQFLIKKGENPIEKINIIETYPVIIAKPNYSFDDFQNILEKEGLLWK